MPVFRTQSIFEQQGQQQASPPNDPKDEIAQKLGLPLKVKSGGNYSELEHVFKKNEDGSFVPGIYVDGSNGRGYFLSDNQNVYDLGSRSVDYRDFHANSFNAYKDKLHENKQKLVEDMKLGMEVPSDRYQVESMHETEKAPHPFKLSGDVYYWGDEKLGEDPERQLRKFINTTFMDTPAMREGIDRY